jgi:hypothetical protein
MFMSTRTFNSLPASRTLPGLHPANGQTVEHLNATRNVQTRVATTGDSDAKKRKLASVNEALLVMISLATIAALSGSKATDWMGAAAVFITFLHGQLSFDMQESQGKMPEPSVENYHWSGRLFVAKELLWIATFMMTGSWPLCAGSIIFATYPHWRAFLRR